MKNAAIKANWHKYKEQFNDDHFRIGCMKVQKSSTAPNVMAVLKTCLIGELTQGRQRRQGERRLKILFPVIVIISLQPQVVRNFNSELKVCINIAVWLFF